MKVDLSPDEKLSQEDKIFQNTQKIEELQEQIWELQKESKKNARIQKYRNIAFAAQMFIICFFIIATLIIFN